MSQSAYAAPAKLDEIVGLLAGNPGAHLLAGGQNLLLEPRRSQITGSLLVDLRNVPGLAAIQVSAGGGVRIGAMTTIGAIADNAAIRDVSPVLAETAAIVGDAQVRNRATLGGALVAAEPGSDLAPVLLVLGVVLEITGPKGARSLDASAFFTGPGKTALSPAEVITRITIPSTVTGAAYERMKDPATLYAVCGVAACVVLSQQGAIARCQIAATGSTAYPMRLPAIEKALTGAKPDAAAVSAAAGAITDDDGFRGNFYASKEYRVHLTRVLTERALKRAVARATT